MSLLSVANVTKRHGADVVVDNVSFTVDPMYKVAIAGETGSGKTTLLRIIAGLGQADSGEVLFQGQKVKGVNEKLMPGHGGIAYLSQHFELNNNYRVEEVLSYSNNLTKESSDALIDVCHIKHLLKRLTQTLSGGERQRVALARLLTFTPKLLLLDEPFSNMDLIHKTTLKAVVAFASERMGITCMLISHDPADLLPWADELMIMQNGKVIQRGAPMDVYRSPVNTYAAGLLGKYNLINLELATQLPGGYSRKPYVRPEEISIVAADAGGLKSVIQRVLFYGGHYELEVAIAAQTLIVRTDKPGYMRGEVVYISL